MKKKYETPAMEIVEIEPMQLLDGSPIRINDDDEIDPEYSL